jgi:hypothetical protein
MHIGRKTQTREGGRRLTYLLLRRAYRDERGTPRERVLYLGPELADDLEARAAKKLRKTGYTPKQIEAILAAVRAKVAGEETVPIVVRGKPVLWKDPPKK